MVKSITAELIYKTQVICGEGPTWDEEAQKLYWIDIVNNHVYLFNPENGSNTGYNVGSLIGALTLREKGGLLLALETGFNFFDLETGKVERIIDPENEFPDHYFNDGKCDPSGRFWAGTYHKDTKDAVGSLYSLESDLSVKKRHENIILSNGLAWSPDQTKFYYIDSIAQCVYVFDYDSNSGNITNQKILKKIQEEIELPDGMTIDTEGFLWVAVFNSGKVIRIDPQSGETVFEVVVPEAKQATSCAFGGKDLDELYITSAKILDGVYGIPEEELDSQQNAGGLFRVKLPFQGLPTVRFNC